MQSDIEFVAQFHDELAQDYRVAKSYLSDVPTHALLHIRSFAHRLTAYLAQHFAAPSFRFEGPNLYERIEQLNQMRLIDVRTTRALHKLRADGNRGAHPEKYHLTESQLIALANRSLKDCRTLLEYLYPKVKDTQAPEYHVASTEDSSGRDICYRAVMENDSLAQYLVGMSLKTKGLMLKEAAVTDPTSGVMSADEMLKRAAYWFELAAPYHHDALHEHGVALIHGYAGETDILLGEQIIAQAADKAVPNAMALLGYFYLVGSQSVAQDAIKAEHYLRAGAAQEQTEAMANLGVLYYQAGKLTQAFEWISKAAKAGFPHAQYHLALMLASGDGCQVDAIASEQWMAEAAEQGQLDAMFARAQHMLNDETAAGSDMHQAEQYLRDVIQYRNSVPAMIELSMALTDGVLGRIDVVGAADLLRRAKRAANSQEAQVIEPLWQSLRLQIDKVLTLSESDAEKAALNKARELLSESINS